jgi:hypothetical protein
MIVQRFVLNIAPGDPTALEAPHGQFFARRHGDYRPSVAEGVVQGDLLCLGHRHTQDHAQESHCYHRGSAVHHDGLPLLKYLAGGLLVDDIADAIPDKTL